MPQAPDVSRRAAKAIQLEISERGLHPLWVAICRPYGNRRDPRRLPSCPHAEAGSQKWVSPGASRIFSLGSAASAGGSSLQVETVRGRAPNSGLIKE